MGTVTFSADKLHNPLLKATYYKPDARDLCSFADDLKTKGLYQKITFLPEQIKIHPCTNQRHLCDVISFEKRAIQITAETLLSAVSPAQWIQALFNKMLCPLASFQKKQEKALNDLFERSVERLQTWNYESLELCREPYLLEYHFKQQSGEFDALLLFYQKEGDRLPSIPEVE